MEKKYMKPEMVIVEVATCIPVQASPQNVTISPNQTTSGPEDFEAKGRDEDYESNTWSDGGLW